MNKAILIGRIGKDAVSKTLTNGDAWATCSLATSKSWKDKEGEYQDRTEWHNLVFWRKQAENAAKVLQKGDLVSIEGEIKTRKWTDDSQIVRYTTEIHVRQFRKLAWKKQQNQAPAPVEPPH